MPSRADTAYMRESAAAVLDGPAPLGHWILWSAVAFVVAAITWAALAQVDQIVVGQGRVIPSSRVQIVQNLEGGIVSSIAVQAGDVVTKDQVLMHLDNTRWTSQLREGEAKDVSLRARIARLAAEADGKPFSAPADLARDRPEVVAEERGVFDTRRRELQSNLQVLRQQATQRSQELDEMRARERQLASSLALAKREVELTRPLAAMGDVSEVEMLRLQRAANDVEGDLEASRLALPRLASALAEVQQKASSIEAQFRAEAAHELSLARGDQAASSAANVGLEDRVTRTVVRAPVAGIVKQVKVNTVGGVVQPGMDLVEIVPSGEDLLVEARVKPSDIAFLRVGQPATVKLSAYDFSIYGGFEAKLEHIGADTIEPETPSERNLQPYYLIRVRTTSSKLPGLDTTHVLPGMEATVDVRTNRHSILQYLLKPLVKTRERALREP